jgi:hypothetical protein
MSDREYRSWDPEAVSHLAIGQKFFEDCDFVGAHASYGELKLRHPDGQFITFLREPKSRLISLRTFLRGFSDEVICKFGTFGMHSLRARLDLKSFLAHPYFAASCDNVATRMLLYENPLILPNDFISPSNDAEILDAALAVLHQFSFVGAVENKQSIADLSDFLACPFVFKRENETPVVPEHLRCDLYAELDSATLNLLDSHSRLDLQLWKMAMGVADDADLLGIQSRSFEQCVTKHAALLGGSASHPAG